MGAELEFEQQAFVELLSEDGLIILARYATSLLHIKSRYNYALFRGLGLDRIFLKFLKLYSDPHSLVLVLNCTGSQEVCVLFPRLSGGRGPGREALRYVKGLGLGLGYQVKGLSPYRMQVQSL